MRTRASRLKSGIRQRGRAIVPAPLMLALSSLSVAITLTIMIYTVADGRAPAWAPFGLIGAILLAAVAATEASRPVRREPRRRLGSPGSTRRR